MSIGTAVGPFKLGEIKKEKIPQGSLNVRGRLNVPLIDPTWPTLYL